MAKTVQTELAMTNAGGTGDFRRVGGDPGRRKRRHQLPLHAPHDHANPPKGKVGRTRVWSKLARAKAAKQAELAGAAVPRPNPALIGQAIDLYTPQRLTTTCASSWLIRG
jgi:hypothetical protein